MAITKQTLKLMARHIVEVQSEKYASLDRWLIAGGALRDLEIGAVPKDIDIFVRADNMEDVEEWERKFAVGHVLTYVGAEVAGEYEDGFVQKFLKVSNFVYVGDKIQVIFLKSENFGAGNFRKEVLNSFDLAICQIGMQYDKANNRFPIFRGQYYNNDKAAKLVALTDYYVGNRELSDRVRMNTQQRALRLGRKLHFDVDLIYAHYPAVKFPYVPAVPEPVVVAVDELNHLDDAARYFNWGDIRPAAPAFNQQIARQNLNQQLNQARQMYPDIFNNIHNGVIGNR